MNITSDPNLWAICALTFLLGLLIGVFMTAGGRRKWKTRYNDEVGRHEALQREHRDRTREWEAREKDLINRPVVAPVVAAAPVAAAETRRRRNVERDAIVDRDIDGDGVPDDIDRRPTDDREA